MPRPDPGRAWMARARCRAGNPEWWFPEGRHPDDHQIWDLPRSWCRLCIVHADCRAWIDRAEHGAHESALAGMWASETPRQRRARRKGSTG
jgi:hypothetical protein